MNNFVLVAWMAIGIITWHHAFKHYWRVTTIASHGFFIVAILICMLVASFVLSLLLGPLTFFVFIGDRE
jgi:hypothetical protein